MSGVSLIRATVTTESTTRRLFQAAARGTRSGGTGSHAAAPSAADVRASARSLGAAVRNAVNAVSLRAVSSPRPTRIVPVAIASALSGTREVNSQTSTVRRSGVALGLDVTTAAAASRLTSTAGLGLDVTTAQAASVLASSAALGLDVTDRVTTLVSTAEANTMPTSYGVIQPTFSAGISVSTLSGTYAGTGAAANATSLTLTITSPSGTINGIVPTLVAVNVKDQNSTDLGTVSALITTGGTISLGSAIGLSISFGAGSVTQNATASFTVSNSTPTTVDANAAFNAGVNTRPRFDGGATVSAGAFKVNGTTVNVLANDTISTVLSRINSTVSGVTASFAGDKVTIQSTGPSETAITVTNDTSGFLSALKLSGASATVGNIRDDQQVLDDTTQFGSVTTGSFTVNGVSISVNHTTDTLASIVSLINSAGAGVTATYDSAADKVRLTSATNSESDIVVAGDTSGFLAAAGLNTGNTVRGNIHDDVQTLNGVSAFAAVTAGSFTINGTTINVDPATQTLQSLISTINAAGAGVTASFDAGTNKVSLTTTANSEDDIVVASDTSGFLTAVKLAAATTVKGNIADDQQVLSKTTQFATVVNGSFSVNGQSILVSRTTDTVQSIVARINGEGAGVTASYDTATDKLVITPSSAGAPLVVANDTSGFLAAASVASGATGTRVNTAAAFNATGSGAPLFDPGQGVVAGSFTVNGVTINVAANDTITSVLGKITSSAAGVTATFDEARESVRLVAKEAGSTPITVADDTSGFLAAVKLDGTAANAAGRVGAIAVEDASAPSAATGAAGPLADAVTKMNDVLQLVEESRGLPSDLRAALTRAIHVAVASVPAGLTITRVDGKEKVVMDTAALEEALAIDPKALDALVNCADALPNAVDVALAESPELPATTVPPATAVAVDSRIAELVRAAQATNDRGKIELLNALPLRAPIPARGRVDLLA